MITEWDKGLVIDRLEPSKEDVERVQRQVHEYLHRYRADACCPFCHPDRAGR